MKKILAIVLMAMFGVSTMALAETTAPVTGSTAAVTTQSSTTDVKAEQKAVKPGHHKKHVKSVKKEATKTL